MPCNAMTTKCLLPGTSYKEHGIRVSVQPKSGERWQFFVIDDQSRPACTLRQDLKIRGALCDVVVLCHLPNAQLPIICLVELKGRDSARAVEQVLNTRAALLPHFRREHKCTVQWRAFIRRHGGAPKQHERKLRARLIKVFGKGNVEVVSRNTLGAFLRRRS